MVDVPLWAWWLLAGVVLVGAWVLSRRRVPQGFECVVERGGKYSRTLHAGSHTVAPLLERAGRLIDIRESQLKVRTVSFVSRDEVEVEVTLSCFMQIIDAAKASYEVRDVATAVEDVVRTQVANHLAGCPLGQLLTDRERALRELPEQLDRATDPWGVKVTRLDIADVRPPAALLQAILEEKRVEHEQRALLLAEQGERVLMAERAAKDQEIAGAAEEQALAATRASERAALLAAEQARDEQRRRADSDRSAAEAALQAEREQREREIESARLRSEEARAQAALARAERDAAAALAWQETLDRLQREREEAAQQQRRMEQEATHTAELARLAAGAELDAAAQRAAQDEQAADAAHRASLAAASRSLEVEQQRRAAELETARAAQQASLAAIDQQRAIDLARVAAERERDEAAAAAKLRIAELAHAEAREYAAAREAQARADANAVRSLSDALRGVDAATLGYLGAREQAEALRSLAGGGAPLAAVGAAAALLTAGRAAPAGLAQPNAVTPSERG